MLQSYDSFHSQVLRDIIKFSPKVVFFESTRACYDFASLNSNFQLKFVLQLIRVDWPLSIMSMFDWVRFFSFSINVVRPECAFSWKFETKVIVTLLTPISLSFLVCIFGLVYGMISCFKMWKQLERARLESGRYLKISYLSTLSCW